MDQSTVAGRFGTFDDADESGDRR